MAAVLLTAALGACLPRTAEAANNNLVWATAMGGAGPHWGRDIAVDEAGNVYATGKFEGTADFGPFQLNAVGSMNTFVTKQAPDGTFLWARSIGGAGNEGEGIAVDSAGNVYTMGEFFGTVDFDPGPGSFNLTSAGERDSFVLKLDTNGEFVWARSMSGTDWVAGAAIELDAAGNAYITGSFIGTVNFGPFPLASTSTLLFDPFICKVDPEGNFVWARSFSGLANVRSNGIAVDGGGYVYTVGYFGGTTDFDPGPGTFNLTSAVGFDAFVSKLDNNGNFVWARALVSDEFFGQDIAVDATGNVYTTGSFRGTADFNPGPDTFNLTSTGVRDIFVSKLDTNGNFVWARSMGGAEGDIGRGITVDGVGNVYTTGEFRGTADFDPGPGVFNIASGSAVFRSIFLSKLDMDGDFVWAGSFGRGQGDGIVVDLPGNVYTTGRFSGTADFDLGPGTFNLTSAGSTDIYVVKSSELPPIAIDIHPTNTTGPTNASNIDFLVEFDKPVVSFDNASDLVITHSGTANTGATVTGGPEVYTVTVEGISGDGSFTLAVNTTSNVQDLLGNALASSVTSDPVLIDNTPPVVTITSDFGNGPGEDFLTGISPFPLEGTTSSDTMQVRVNGGPIAYTQGSGSWVSFVDIAALGPVASFTVEATDFAGNVSAPVLITITHDPLNDADGNGLTDQEEWDLQNLEGIPTDPLDPLLPRADWFVSAASGSDAVPAIDGGGTEATPWQTINFALSQLAPLARENFPITIWLDGTPTAGTKNSAPIALYLETPFTMLPYTTLAQLAPEAGVTAQIRPDAPGFSPLITAAEGAVLRDFVLAPAVGTDFGRPLLVIADESALVERVTFDGRSVPGSVGRPGTIGIFITGAGSSDSRVRLCSFLFLGRGIWAIDSGVALSDNAFDSINADGNASRAIAYFTTIAKDGSGGQTPVVGDRERIVETGFNVFRNLPSGAKAIEFTDPSEVPTELLSAQYNDWGVYTEAEIRNLVDGVPDELIEVSPFIPVTKSIRPGSIVGVVLDAETNSPIPLGLEPRAQLNGEGITNAVAPADRQGLFQYPVVLPGNYTIAGRAYNFLEGPELPVSVAPTATVVEAPRLLLLPEASSGIPGDLNGDGVVDDFELLVLIDQWEAGLVSNFELLLAIENWEQNFGGGK